MTEANREYILNRYPLDDYSQLQAWDAADEYLLQHILHTYDLGKNESILVVNDNFGALTLGLDEYNITTWTDSFCSVKAIKANMRANAIRLENVRFLHSLDNLDLAFDVIVLKIPKSLVFLESQLKQLRPLVNAGAQIVGGGMTKTIHNSTLALFSKIIGPTKSSLAVKKARLIFAELGAKEQYRRMLDSAFTFGGKSFITKPGVFSFGKLDQGSQHLLAVLKTNESIQDVIDLGCGCGILGIEASFLYPNATLTFVDDSSAAIESAKENVSKIIPQRQSDFVHGDCLASAADASADLILCNPPFHQNNANTTITAERMFADSKRVLREGGKLMVVGNKHLGYHKRLEELFGQQDELFSDQKYVVLSCQKYGSSANFSG